MDPKDVWCLKVLVLEGSSLPWSMRYKVAVGIAKPIGYLHNGTERCVVHRDIKPSNILLSSKKTPKVRKWFVSLIYILSPPPPPPRPSLL
ncbi:hypothetical protein LguiB_002181 [Lonicera macranthoides]